MFFYVNLHFMFEKSKLDIQLVRIGLLFFVAMLILGLKFEEERTTFVDIAFHLYEQAATGEVAIQNYRFVSVITQWIPTQLLRAGVEMKFIQLAYSLIFPVFYGGVWAFTHFVLKAKQWALAWALMWLTFATHTYFWIQSELPQGLAIFVLALGLISYRKDKKWLEFAKQAFLAILLGTVAFAHPLLVVPVTFSFGLICLLGHVSKMQLLLPVAIYYPVYLIKTLALKTPYDAVASGGIKIGIKTLLRFEIPYSIPNFFANLATTYYAFFFVGIIGIWLLWRAGFKLAASWTLAAVVGHIGLVALAYSTSATPDFYIENLYLPAGFMAAAGLTYGVKSFEIKSISKKPSIYILIFLVLRIGHIGWTGETVYTQRLTQFKTMLSKHKNEKVIYKETPELRERLIETWGTGYEAWVLSARNKKFTQGFLVHKDPKEIKWAIDDPNRLILNFHQYLFDELPKQYFKQPKRGQQYRIIEP